MDAEEFTDIISKSIFAAEEARVLGLSTYGFQPGGKFGN